MSGRPSVLHLDGGRVWAGGQNQVRLLMRALADRGIGQLCICPRGSPLESRLAAEGLPVRGCAWRGALDPRAVVAVTRAAGRFDILHAHDAHALQVALAGAAVRRFAGPVGRRSAGDAPRRPERGRARPAIVAARRVHFATSALKWNRADRVVAISEVVRVALVGSGVAAARIRTIHSGIDVDEVRSRPPLEPTLRRRLGLGADDFLVGNIGHLHTYKGQTVIPAAAAVIDTAATGEAVTGDAAIGEAATAAATDAAAAPAATEASAATAGPVHWVIIGEGPERGALEAAVSKHGVAPRVHLTGEIPDARRALRELNVFAFTSPDEPLGTSVLDAMAADVPVVGADAAGAREILAPVHARTGASLVPAGDAEALARAVGRVRTEPGLRSAMIAAQRARLDDYRIEATAEATLEVYRELVGG